MAKPLPARPNLDHLRRQAKTLLADLNRGDLAAAKAFISFLPAAKTLTPAKVRSAGYRLADAQSVVARQTGFDKWPALKQHVEHLRALEGEWQFVSLQVDGGDLPAAAFGSSRLLIDGDCFRMESAEATYEGTFVIDVSAEPARIDIAFVEGPEAGHTSLGIYALSGDQLTMCVGLTGASRPNGFVTSNGSGHALERLRRASAARPSGVTGGTRSAAGKTSTATSPSAPVEATSFDVARTPLLDRLQGTWKPTELVTNGEPMKKEWLAFGKRETDHNDVKVIFNGQVMLHAKMRIDEGTSPVSVDYLNLSGTHKGQVGLGIMDWVGDEVRFIIAQPGQPRPTAFVGAVGTTLSQWRR